MSKQTFSEFVPGMAYEQIMAADFMAASGKALKALPEEAKATRVALKEAEKRRKGRGYRYLVTADAAVATYLCDWFHDFLASESYTNLGTAQRLAIRTVADRFCDFSRQANEQEGERRTAMQARAERMRQGKERKRQEREREAATLAEKEAREELPKLQAKLNKLSDEYGVLLTKAGKTKDTKKALALLDDAARIQNKILSESARERKLKGMVA